MASLTKITIKKELRLCKVGKELGYFHCWEQYGDVLAPGGQYSRVFGLVEFDDGIERVSPEKIKFVDETNASLQALNKINREENCI